MALRNHLEEPNWSLLVLGLRQRGPLEVWIDFVGNMARCWDAKEDGGDTKMNTKIDKRLERMTTTKKKKEEGQ